MSRAEKNRPPADIVSDATVVLESWDSLFACWRNPKSGLPWDCLFMLPPWLKAWWEVFGAGRQAHLCAVRRGSQTLGLLPLVIDGETARLMGDRSVCDYGDVVVSPAGRSTVLATLLDYLGNRGISHLDLGCLPVDGPALAAWRQATSPPWRIHEEAESAIYALDLPGSWDRYLEELAGPQRHELRRKMRRLHEAGPVAFRSLEKPEEISQAMNTFLTLFRQSRRDKARFMTETMETFFRRLTESMSAAGLCRLQLLHLDQIPVATTLCFPYRDTVYLYNSGYDRSRGGLSVGLICKALSIGRSIEEGYRAYDFLKGHEPYKGRLGGKPLGLHRIRLTRGAAGPAATRGGRP